MKTITIKNDYTSKCPECNGELEYQEKWDELFDYYDRNTPAHDLVVQRIYNDRQPKYICKDCGVGILVKER